MRFILVLFMLSSCTVSNDCNKQIEKTFFGFKETLLNGTNPAKYFSHEFLVKEVDSLFLVNDDSSLLHNAKVTIHSLSNYKLQKGTSKVESCNESNGVLHYNPIEYKKDGSYKFSYVFESNKWLIDSVFIDFRRVKIK